jgi:ADP-ribosylation factor-like protein 2
MDKNESHNWTIISSSAVTGEGLKDGMEWILDDAKNRLFLL